MATKICKKCGKEKPIDDFYKHKEMLDGHLNICKECVKSRVNAYRAKNIEKIREYDRNRPNKTQRAKKEREKIKNDIIRYEKYKKAKNQWAKRNRNKRNAHNKLRKAIVSGKIIKTNFCQVCGKNNCQIHGHHFDYTQPLNVIWVCSECHGRLHKKYNI